MAIYGGRDIQLRAHRLLMATGRQPVSDGLALDMAGVATGRHGAIVVNEQLRTGSPHIWAAGDVTGAPRYVYVAAAHGRIAADNALADSGQVVDHTQLSRVTFTTMRSRRSD
jgi:mercuric reductase